jgi:CheY-like chemotaxis protein
LCVSFLRVMKPARSVSIPKPPGALSVETLGGLTTIPTSTTSSQAHSGTRTCQEYELLPGPPSSRAEKRPKPVHAARPLTRVLVADESPTERALLTRSLEEEGYEVIAVSSGQEATERLAGGGFDLVLLDLDMTSSRGWSTFEEMVALKEDQAIILMTDPLGELDVKTTGHLARVVEKPLNISVLLTTIQKTLTEPVTTRHSALASQQDLARYAKPYVSSHFTVESYDHWGLND